MREGKVGRKGREKERREKHGKVKGKIMTK